jgi:hypothetical protein
VSPGGGEGQAALPLSPISSDGYTSLGAVDGQATPGDLNGAAGSSRILFMCPLDKVLAGLKISTLALLAWRGCGEVRGSREARGKDE